MKCVRLVRFSLLISDTDGIPVDEVVQWIYDGMQEYCEFDYAEIEDKARGPGGEFILELKIILEHRVSNKQTTESLIETLNKYCEFDDVELELLESHDGIWVRDDYSLADSN